ncbi:MAG TPA: carbon-nitrogen hydrolase family protein [Nocardioidaceae bacterium]|nr:carbon-nitrogen hydrolase family protein [Nocardioidaceae bacterium]
MRVALIQLEASTDSERNRDAVRKRLDGLDGAGLDLVVLPEGSMHDFGPPDHDLSAAAEPLDGPYVEMLTDQARHLGATVIGHIFERHESGGRPYNTTIVIGPDGAIRTAYRKVHLYDSFGYVESDRLSAGPIETVTVDVDGFRIGLLTCYDLRFPEFARLLVDRGADVFAVPTAWVSGQLKEDHWETLLRARAIENTVYALGAAQCGRAYAGRSMVVDPMGIVVAGAGESDADVVADLSADRISAARKRNPSLANRRIGSVPGATL